MRAKRFAPVLRYLVDVGGGLYVHPDVLGFTAGQEAWANPRLQFRNHGDAKAVAEDISGASVVKLRIHAVREPIRRDNRANLDHVPRAGDIAMMQGWGTKANPHPADTVAAMRWLSDWWRANADAFEDHVHGHEE